MGKIHFSKFSIVSMQHLLTFNAKSLLYHRKFFLFW